MPGRSPSPAGSLCENAGRFHRHFRQLVAILVPRRVAILAGSQRISRGPRSSRHRIAFFVPIQEGRGSPGSVPGRPPRCPGQRSRLPRQSVRAAGLLRCPRARCELYGERMDPGSCERKSGVRSSGLRLCICYSSSKTGGDYLIRLSNIRAGSSTQGRSQTGRHERASGSNLPWLLSCRCEAASACYPP